MKRLLSLLLSLLPAAALAQPVAPPVEAPPVIKLPPFNPAKVAKFDPAAVKARDLPYHVTLVKAPEAWARNPAAKGKGVTVAILDTGVQADHPGFHGKVVGMYDATRKKKGVANDKHGHGTHCAGIVHAIAPEADLVAIKVLGDDGSGSTADIAHGIDVAVTEFKADVISMSLGGSQRDPYQEPAIKRAIAAGAVVICAAGNDGGPNDTEGYPGRYPDSISVAACDRDRKLAGFSSWGPNVFTADPGVDVLSLLPGTREGEMSGTSMACPVEAGKCASWIASNGIPKNKERRDLFRAVVMAASPFPERNNARGYGLYTLDRITGEVSTPVPPTPGNPYPTEFTLSTDDLTPTARERLKAAGYERFELKLWPTLAAPASPPIRVTEKDGPNGYAECRRVVEAGGVAYLAVGVPAQLGEYHTETLTGFAPGRYRCWNESGRLMMQMVSKTQSARFGQIVGTVGPALTQPAYGGSCPGGQCPTPVIGRWR